MRRIPHLIVRGGIGLAAAGTVLALLLPWLIRAGYLEIGSRHALWIIAAIVAGCLAVTMRRL